MCVGGGGGVGEGKVINGMKTYIWILPHEVSVSFTQMVELLKHLGPWLTWSGTPAHVAQICNLYIWKQTKLFKLLAQASSPKEKKKGVHFAPFPHDLPLLNTTAQHTAILALEDYTVCSSGVGS